MAVVSFPDALKILEQQAASLAAPAAESVPLLQAVRRVLAEPVLADRDQPPFDRSTRDGYAVRTADLPSHTPLVVVGQLAAGQLWKGRSLDSGEAIQIMTGAPLPRGADAVLMVEHVLQAAGQSGSATIQIQPERTLEPGENIVRQGSEAQAGAQLIPPGVRVAAAEIALAAAAGYATLSVYVQPQVGIIATGDELVELDQPLERQQIRNSNSYALATMIDQAGGQARRLPIAADTREAIRARILAGRRHQLLVLSGGVSMGEFDLVEAVLAEFGAEFFFTGVAMQPGRPVVFGRLPASDDAPACFFFGLPGNPISTQVTFHCFVQPFLRALGGEHNARPRFTQGTLSVAIAAKPGLTRLLPARREDVAVRTVPWQGSGDLQANARANCYAELLPGRAYLPGDVIRILER